MLHHVVLETVTHGRLLLNTVDRYAKGLSLHIGFELQF